MFWSAFDRSVEKGVKRGLENTLPKLFNQVIHAGAANEVEFLIKLINSVIDDGRIIDQEKLRDKLKERFEYHKNEAGDLWKP